MKREIPVYPRIAFQHPPIPGLVSAIVPTFNRGPTVTRAISSALAQTYRDLEVIVVDDGSTDDTESIVRASGRRVRYIRQPNGGVASARNTGMMHARGEFIAFLDSDDEWIEWKIEAQLTALQRHPEVGLVWTDMTAVDVDGSVVHERYLRMSYDAYAAVDIDTIMAQVGTLSDLLADPPRDLAAAAIRVGDLSSAIILGNLLHTSTVLVRRAWVQACGGQHTSWETGEDYEYYTRICGLGPVMLIDAPSIHYRVGAADQLTAPAKMLPLARNNLRTVRARLADRGSSIRLPRRVMRWRLASSLAWIGDTEFAIGRRRAAARHLGASLRLKPRLDRRMVLLLCCALPRRAIDALRVLKHWRDQHAYH